MNNQVAPYIEAKNLKYIAGQRTILDIDNFSINKGEFGVLIGPNGAGKTTLLRILSLIQKPSEGSVYISGQQITGYKQVFNLRRQMTMLFQLPILFGTRTVFENVAYPLNIRKENKDLIAGKVNKILESFKIAHLSKDKAWSISGGEARRVSIARALVFKPKVLFLDEPFTFIDGWDQKNLLADIYRFIRQENITTIYSTNKKEEVIEKADKLVVINKGRIADDELMKSLEKTL